MVPGADIARAAPEGRVFHPSVEGDAMSDNTHPTPLEIIGEATIVIGPGPAPWRAFWPGDKLTVYRDASGRLLVQASDEVRR